MNEAELRAVCAGLFPSGRPVDFPCLAASLPAASYAPYQVAAVRQGKIRGLVIGEYIVLDKIGPGAWEYFQGPALSGSSGMWP